MGNAEYMGISETETTSTFSTTKMKIFLLVPLLCLLCPTHGQVALGLKSCRGKEGTKKVEETWYCGRSTITCGRVVEDCSDCGEKGTVESGFVDLPYSTSGESQTGVVISLQSWDCRHKCNSNSVGVRGAQERQSFKQCRRPTTRPTTPDKTDDGDCSYSCVANGGCHAEYNGRWKYQQGSCFPKSFGGGCSGMPRECSQDWHTQVNCG